MRPLDCIVMAACGPALLGIGVYFARRQRDATDYFLGKHDLPWWAVMLSIVATETSALTVISVPGIAARGDLTFLQLPFGYLLGRVGVALWLLPGYFTGRQETAYTRLGTRFGAPTRRLASGTFLAIRALGDSVRVFATAIPLAIVTHWSLATSVLVVICVTLAYTWGGGLKAVVWVDLLQLCIYLFGAVATLWAASRLAGGFGHALARASALHKLRVVDFHLSLTEPYTLLGGLVGGAMLSAASHGTDHLIVQRLLATRSLRDARLALVGCYAQVDGEALAAEGLADIVIGNGAKLRLAEFLPPAESDWADAARPPPTARAHHTRARAGPPPASSVRCGSPSSTTSRASAAGPAAIR